MGAACGRPAAADAAVSDDGDDDGGVFATPTLPPQRRPADVPSSPPAGVPSARRTGGGAEAAGTPLRGGGDAQRRSDGAAWGDAATPSGAATASGLGGDAAGGRGNGRAAGQPGAPPSERGRIDVSRGTPQPPEPPKLHWQRGELIGTGAFGRVHLGLNEDTGELIAARAPLRWLCSRARACKTRCRCVPHFSRSRVPRRRRR
jgi:hypothetical protein